MSPDTVKIIVSMVGSFFTGGVLGALLANRAAVSRQRTDIALALIKDTYAKWTETRNICEKLLNVCENKIERGSWTESDERILEKTGDWYELVTKANQLKIADQKLFDTLMKKEAVYFAAIVGRAHAGLGKFLDKDYLNEWPTLRQLRDDYNAPLMAHGDKQAKG